MVSTRFCFSATLLLIAFTFSGCFVPVHVAENPHVAGRVLDADTKLPIAGATLQFERFQKSPVVTAADGSFDIPELQRLKLYPVPLPDFYARWQHLVVRAGAISLNAWHTQTTKAMFMKRSCSSGVNHLTRRCSQPLAALYICRSYI
jgi:hypothetical protein